MSDVIAEIGHNNPPTPMESCAGQYDDILSEAQNWTDGEAVETEDQMKAVDALLKGVKAYRSDLKKAVTEYTAPFHAVWKEKVAEGKVYTEDADAIQGCLVAAVAPFKVKLAEEQAAKERAAWEAANAARREAEAKAAAANAADLEAQREAAAAKQAVIDAEKAAKAVAKEAPKGMRKVDKHEVLSMRDLVNWIATNDKPAMADFATEYARNHHKEIPDDVVRSWVEKGAF